MARILLSVALMMLPALNGCERAPPQQNAQPAVENKAAPPPISLPAPEPPLQREALLLAVVRARSAAAAGTDDRAAQAELDGKRFELRLRFCGIAAPPLEAEAEARRALAPAKANDSDAAPAGLTGAYAPEDRRIALRAAPNLTLGEAAAASLAADAYEGVEGFWIPHPWLLTPGCPDTAAGERSVGIAQFFTADQSRAGRRDGRAYEARQTLPEGAAPDGMAWDLVLRGRLRPLRDGRVILCVPVPGGMPACILSAEFERVTIENATSGEQLAEWGRG